MLDIATINQSIRHYVAQVTGLDINENVRKANQDAPTGSDPYATVLITPLTTEGHDSVTYTDQADPDIDLDQLREGNRVVLASINFFQAGAINFVLQMQGSAYEVANQDFLRSKFLGFIRAGQYNDLTEIDLSRYEQRAQLDMFFYVIDDNSNVVSSTQQVDIETNFDDYQNLIEVRPI